MNENEKESRDTLAGIVAEMRRGTKLPGYWRSCDLNEILKYHANRIEEALKQKLIVPVDVWNNMARKVENSGNAAAMREALESARNWCLNRLGNASYQVTVEGLLSVVDAALSAPPRQCDVGTPEEQYRRFWDMCSNKDVNKCAYCEFRRTFNLNCSRDKCFANWAQMPYEAEGGAK